MMTIRIISNVYTYNANPIWAKIIPEVKQEIFHQRWRTKCQFYKYISLFI
jgi:hypothetical protein